MQRTKVLLMLAVSALFCSMIISCSPTDQKVRIAVNPWPGYELLYLAEQKGLFHKHKLDIELLQLASLADVKRAFEQGRADGMASTMIEVISAAEISNETLAIVLLADYSSGADVIITKPEIKSLEELKGMRIGTEFSSLGLYFLTVSLEQHGLTLDDIIAVNVEQLEAEEFLFANKIDAMTTYPPFATPLLKFGYHSVFDSADLKEPITDLITVRRSIIEKDPYWHSRFQQMWQDAYDYMKANPQESYKIMARREGITPLDFELALQTIDIIQGKYQDHLLGSPQMQQQIEKTCQLIQKIRTAKVDCATITRKVIPLPTPLAH